MGVDDPSTSTGVPSLTSMDLSMGTVILGSSLVGSCIGDLGIGTKVSSSISMDMGLAFVHPSLAIKVSMDMGLASVDPSPTTEVLG